MVAAHVLDARTPDGDPTLSAQLVDGRASALFAVLAGVSLVLLSRRTPRSGLVVRSVLVAVVGLALGQLETGIAVILTYYGVLFLLGLPFLTLRARALFPLALAWAVAAPVLSHLLRPGLPDRGFANPHLAQLGDPGQLLSELLFTGYYPAVPWLAYLLLGMALARCDLRAPVTQLRLVLGGTAVAVASYAVSRALSEQPWALERLGLAPHLVDRSGTTPTDSWAWLLTVAPHSATPFDLLHTGAGAAAVTGFCLLVAGLLPDRPLAVLFGAGTMTLSLYSLHVVMRTEEVWPPEEPSSFGWHVLVLMTVGAVFVLLRRRGPLEALLSRLSALPGQTATSGSERAAGPLSSQP